MNYTELMVWRHIVQHITAGIQVCVGTCGNEMSDLLYNLFLWINFVDQIYATKSTKFNTQQKFLCVR